jgi:serine/threonine protein kinase
VTHRPSWGLSAGDPIGDGRAVVRVLGGGKRTEVLLATDEERGTPVVVKVLRPGVDGAGRRALAAEAELVGALAYPVFPRLIATELDAEPARIVLEHVEGPRLSTLARKHGPLAEEQLAALAVELVRGICYLHDRGYVHLDIKPSNTIMAAVPRVIDLGVARTIEAASRVRGVVGTHRFQAPEQHHAEPFGGLTPKADVWGVAVTVLFAAQASSPFGPLRDVHGERRPLTEQDVEGLTLPRWLPRGLAAAIGDALAWRPDDRPTAAELVARLERGVSRAPRRSLFPRRGPGRRSLR